MSEERVTQLEGRLQEETQRLEKLYVAYRRLEEELQEKNAVIDVLEKEAIDKEIEREGLESLLGEKDSRIRDLEMDHAKARKRIQHLEPDLEKMEEMYSRESARLGRVSDARICCFLFSRMSCNADDAATPSCFLPSRQHREFGRHESGCG